MSESDKHEKILIKGDILQLISQSADVINNAFGVSSDDFEDLADAITQYIQTNINLKK